jgi:hypothetical protein
MVLWRTVTFTIQLGFNSECLPVAIPAFLATEGDIISLFGEWSCAFLVRNHFSNLNIPVSSGPNFFRSKTGGDP